MNIKRVLILSGILVLSFGMLGCGGEKWKEVKNVSIEHKSNIGGFENPKLGITVGYDGEVHYSNDGGETWPQANNKSFCRFGLDIVNDKVAWNCGNGGQVRKTTDGGENWEEVSNFGKSEPEQCRYASFIDENTGWLAAPDYLGGTKDGGKTWNDIKLPDGCSKILSIDLLNEKQGYIIGDDSKLYITKDGGETWDSKPINVDDMNTNYTSTNSQAFRFTDDKNGVLFYFAQETLQLKSLKTKDGGETWTENKLPESDFEKGPVYISHDGKLVSINNHNGTKITLLEEE